MNIANTIANNILCVYPASSFKEAILENKNKELVWQAPPTSLNLSKKDAHIWRAALALPIVKIEELDQTLSIDEGLRAGRFHFE